MKQAKKLSQQGNYGKVYKGKWNNKEDVLYKTNKDCDLSLEHEYLISKELQKLNTFFFSQAIYFEKKFNKQILTIKWIDNCGTFLEMLPKLSTKQINNIYLHILNIIDFVQNSINFVHYDLHLNNILIVSTKQKSFKYFDKNMPFYGYRPVIIDFGFSYCKQVCGLKAPLTQTHRGMNPLFYNKYFDKTYLQYNLYNENMKQFNPNVNDKLKSNGMYKMKLSFFDFLTKQFKCSEYEREIFDDGDNDKNYKTIEKKSLRTIYEDKLYSILQNMDNLQHVEEEDVENVTIEDPVYRIQNAIAFWIPIYNDVYKSYMMSTLQCCEILPN